MGIAPVVLVWRDVSYSGALCKWNRFEGGALYSRALYEGKTFRVSFSFLKSCEAPLLLINREFQAVGCAFRCFPYK